VNEFPVALMGITIDIKRILRDFLEKRGFDVRLNGTLVGYSGVKHKFDLVALKGDLTLCIDYTGFDIVSFLKVYLKAVDVDYARIFLLVEEKFRECIPSELTETRKLKLVLFKDHEDLISKMENELASLEQSGNTKSFRYYPR